jgi:hypothetical protein
MLVVPTALLMLVLVLAQMYVGSAQGACGPFRRQEGLPCNASCYDEWRQLRYEGILASQPTFWRYQSSSASFFSLSKGLALDLAVAKCARKVRKLYHCSKISPPYHMPLLRTLR